MARETRGGFIGLIGRIKYYLKDNVEWKTINPRLPTVERHPNEGDVPVHFPCLTFGFRYVQENEVTHLIPFSSFYLITNYWDQATGSDDYYEAIGKIDAYRSSFIAAIANTQQKSLRILHYKPGTSGTIENISKKNGIYTLQDQYQVAVPR